MNIILEEREKALSIIKSFLSSKKINVKKVVLFGSRARGDFKSDSDWDFLIILDRDLPIKERRELSAELRKILVFNNIPSDILIYSENSFKERVNDIGNIAYYSCKEGIELL